MQMQQGDVRLIEVEKLPEGCREVNKDDGLFVLAYGEITGHKHAIEDIGGIRFLEKDGRHYLQTPKKCFEVKGVKEYDHWKEEIRNVQD